MLPPPFLLLSGAAWEELSQPQPERAAAPAGEAVTIRARQQEKAGPVYKLRGDVEIEFRDLVLRGDEVIYDSSTGEVTATGHLVLDGGPHDEHIEASHGAYNVRSQTGRFYDVTGTTGTRFRGHNVTLTSSNPFAFSGRMVEKVGPDRYIVHHGSVTSCEMPNPKWTFNAERMVVEVGGEARIYNSTFRLHKVPIFYFPFAQHPVDSLGRQSGFLVPTFGTSSRKGTIIGESFYWAINRSMDATLGAEYFSSRGWSQHGGFRFRPSEDSYLTATYFGVLDRGFGPSHIDQGGQDVHLEGEAQLPLGFRGVASINYLSSFVFRLAFTEPFTETVNSEVKSLAFLSTTYRGFSFNTLAARYQNFQSTTKGDFVTILHMPSLEVSSVDRRVGRSPLYWSFDAAAEGVSRKEPGFVTNDLVGRFDLHPRASLPVFFRGWTFRPEIALRETYYTQRLDSTGQPIDFDVNRRAVEASFELRPPTLARIFEKPVLGHKLKHTIEARLVYRYVNGVEAFPNIIRFDSRDILSDTSDLEYGVVQRLYAKRATETDCPADEAREPKAASPAPPSTARRMPPASGSVGISPLPSLRGPAAAETPASSGCGNGGAREIVAWELKQKYYFDDTFGGALVPGRRNVFTATDNFTGIAFLTGPRHFSPIVSRLHLHPTNSTDLGWQLDYDTVAGRINASTLFANYRFGNFFIGGSHAFLHALGEAPSPAPDRFNQFRLLVGYGNPNKRGWSAAANVGFDSNFGFLQYSAVQTSYNWDCCGISMEYRRYALGSVRNENQFRFAFTLSNIGSFGNLKRQERIY